MLLYQIFASTIHSKYRKLMKNSKFKISASTWNGEFEWTERSFSVSDIQEYFEYIIEKYETVADKTPTKIYANRIENRITFEIKV